MIKDNDTMKHPTDINNSSFNNEERNVIFELTETDILSFNTEESNLLNGLNETEKSYDNRSLSTIPFISNESIVDNLPSKFFALNELSNSLESFIQNCFAIQFGYYNYNINIQSIILHRQN